MKCIPWKLTAAGAVLAMCSLAVYGQAGGAPPTQDGMPPGDAGQQRPPVPDPARELKMLTRLLTLTPEQQTGVKSLLEQQETQIKAMRVQEQGQSADSETRESHRARMTQMRQIREETSTKISALLDDAQKKTFADWEHQRRDRMGRRRGGPDSQPGGPGGDAPPPPPAK